MNLTKILTPLLLAGTLLGCELKQRVMIVEGKIGNTIQIKRLEYTQGPLFVDREIIAQYKLDKPDDKYFKHEYYPILEIRVRHPLDSSKNIIQYLDDRCESSNTPIVNAYFDGTNWIQRTTENEQEFIQYDHDFLNLKELLKVEETVHKYTK